ncbi:uncharacterized protein LOC141631708 [Silene latifolia]|uniref:uncharacterized protein LOC141631708 n=1 Tax=Silene latifolia TaxID=37657 RepID=UPI003D77192B
MNNTKSEIFFNGMQEEVKEGIKSVTGFKEGVMPFRYLGVPIQPGKICKKECTSLTEKMVSRIRGLGAKKLSYAGRITLINSVLNTLYNYWAQMFVIPQSVIKRIEAICRNFLWDGSPDFHRVPLVAWDTVTTSKKEGGLGIKKADIWNIATVGKLVNWIHTKADRLWIKWINAIYIKDQNWQDYSPPADSTWVWKSICKVKEKLKEGFVNGSWDHHPKGYTIRSGYDWLCSEQNAADWSPVVWNNWNVPKHSIVTWLMMHNGMNVKEKLFKYGCCADDLCVMCESQTETVHHVFSECVYSCRIKAQLSQWFGGPVPNTLQLAMVYQKSVLWKARAACLTAYHYHIWFQRNNARLNSCLVRPEVVARRIGEEVSRRVTAKLGGANVNIDWLALIQGQQA